MKADFKTALTLYGKFATLFLVAVIEVTLEMTDR
jgi:hypothetical protein